MKPRSSSTPLPVMHLSFLLSGAGTLLLGPVLPLFAARWGLHDSQSGLLIAAQFLGLFTGAIAVSGRLRATLLCGCGASAAAFSVLAWAYGRSTGFTCGVAVLYLLGIGLGQITTTINLLSALRFPDPRQRSATLSLLNFTWSAGAVLSPLLAGLFIAHASVPALLLCFSAAAVAVSVVILRFVSPDAQSAQSTGEHPSRKGGLPTTTMVYFAAVFLLYGGLEATVSGWLSTYSLRYAGLSVAEAASSTTALWATFAAGRAVAAFVLKHVPERGVRLAGLVLAAAAGAGLRQAHTGLAVTVGAGMIGLSLAPFFPVTFSLLVACHPRPRQAGGAISNIGLGSAIFPYLLGLASTRLHSLQVAMFLPIGLAAALVVLCALPPQGVPD